MMDGTMISLFRDYEHGRRYKAERLSQGGNDTENASTMPTLLPRTLVTHKHRRGKSYPQVEISRRLLCTATPPPSLQSQSLPKINACGDAARQQHHHSNPVSSKAEQGTVIPSIKCCTTQSLPSLSHSDSNFQRKKLGKKTHKDPQRRSAFNIFKTSRQERHTAARCQNFSWDFSPRTREVPKNSTDTKDRCLQGPAHVKGPRPVHLYMSVEMMDKVLEKRKGLRSDELLNELIGLPPSQIRVSTSHEKIRQRKKEKVKHNTINGNPSQETQHQDDAARDQNQANCKKVTTTCTNNHNSEMHNTTREQLPDENCHSNEMETETKTTCEDKMEDCYGNHMDGEFQDEDEEELEGLGSNEGSDVFDGCEDDTEDNGDVDDEEGEEVSQDEDSEEQEGDSDDEDGFADAEAHDDGPEDDVKHEEDGEDSDDDGPEAEGQDKNDGGREGEEDDSEKEDEAEEADENDEEEQREDGKDDDDNEDDDRTVADTEMEEVLDEQEDGMSDDDNDDQ
ncbi:spore wall protein 2-like [Acanthaster planci]|uniref:Spore wall protein 2-like n=1 Tax=Acanthaster planci TaxID=133434 RepID=A0A8B7ZKA6_ACAPL|nr:spore wall protein 2-like [Acanthaster planci]